MLAISLEIDARIFEVISVNKNVLTIEPEHHLKETFLNNQNFVVTYDLTIEGLPETVLSIPYIMCMSPVVLWVK
jgi:hypothetical protein